MHSMLLITFSLTSIVWLTQALRFIDFIVNQGVSITVFLKLTVLLIPSLLNVIFPPALLVAALFTYNKLTTDSELVVLQAAGLSPWRITLPAVQVGALVALFAYANALYVQPISYRQFRDMQSFLRNNYASILLQDGVFNSPVEGLTVFIRERDKDNILHGILVHDNRDANKAVTMMAEQGRLVETPQGPRFLLVNGNRQERNKGRLSFLNFQSYTLDISLYTKTLSQRAEDPQEMLIPNLFAADSSLPQAEYQKRIAEGHQRLLWPAYSLCLVLVGLSIVLSGDFNRRGGWQRIAMASAIGALLLFSAIGLRSMMAQKPYLIPVAYLNLLTPIAIAAWKLTDHERRQRNAFYPVANSL